MRGFFASSTVQKERPGSLIPKCGLCQLYKGCKSPKMEPHGKGRLGILVVGEAPGFDEDEQGRPFIDKAGQYLRSALSENGFNLDKDAVTTNALICRPPDNKIPDDKMVDYCRPNLLSTIERVQPHVIVPLGRTALESVIAPYWKGGIGPMERWVGWKIPLKDFWVCPAWHPSYLLRMASQSMDREFVKHLKVAFEIKQKAPDPELIMVEAILDSKEAANRIWEMQGSHWVSIDYETNCLKPEFEKARIVSCSISNGEKTIAYPWHGEAIEATKQLWENPKVKKIASNMKFEDRWTKQHLGCCVKNWGWDTMLAAHVLDNRQGICSIKFQAFVQLGINTYNENIEPYFQCHQGLYNRIKEIELSTLLHYNGMDALLEYRLCMLQRNQFGY